MSTAEHPPKSLAETEPAGSLLDAEGLPWLENGEHLDQATYHERYQQTPPKFRAELIGGRVYLMGSSLRRRHGRGDFSLGGWLFFYCSATPGTVAQSNTSTLLDELSETQPNLALLIRPEFGGQAREGDDDFTHGCPELVIETAVSSRSVDLHEKLEVYDRAGAREYLVADLRGRRLHWFVRTDGRLVRIAPGADGWYRSRFFGGLWLDPAAFFQDDKPALLGA